MVYAATTPCSPLARGPELQILRQLELQLGLSRNLLLPTCIYLSAGPTPAPDQCANCGSFAASSKCAQERADGSSASDILRRALVRAEPSPAALTCVHGQQVFA